MMYDDFDFDSANPLKRARGEERQLHIHQARPQARFVMQLVEIYYVKTYKLQCEAERKEGMDVYSLEDLAPSLAQQVAATVHHYQLIPEKNVPLSFARSNAPLDPPKRPFIAAVLAVLIQSHVFEECGAHISLSAFDGWFSTFSRTEGSPISRLWLDAKVYIANCIAKKNRTTVFGQETILKHYDKLQELHSLGDRILWMILRSANYRNLQLHQNERLNPDDLANELPEEELYNAYSASRDTLLWRIWSNSFEKLTSSKTITNESKALIAEKLFIKSIDKSKGLVFRLIRVINGSTHHGESKPLLNELYSLCSGTPGEFAAICLFFALKSSLSVHFSSEPTTKTSVERSAEVMSKLFENLIHYYIFLSPSPRHFHLLDVCQTLWQSSEATHPSSVLTQPLAAARRKKLVPAVYQEEIFEYSRRKDAFLSLNEGMEVQPKPFSACILSGLRSEETLKNMMTCLQIQHKNVKNAGGKSVNVHVDCEDGSTIAVQRRQTANAFLEKSISTSWCMLEIPEDSEKEHDISKRFLRGAADSLLKERVANAISTSQSTNRNSSYLISF